jgi:hypothetical protein
MAVIMKFILNIVLIFPVLLFADDTVISKDVVEKTQYNKSLLKVTVSYGNADAIELKWESAGEAYTYLVMRSGKKNELIFDPLAVTGELNYRDVAAEPGMKYWYKVYPLKNGESPPALASDVKDENLINAKAYMEAAEKPLPVLLYADPAEETPAKTAEPPVEAKYNYSGYRKLPVPEGENIEKMIKEKKEKNPRFRDNEEKLKVARRLEYIKRFYMNPVQFDLTLFMSKPYIKRGELKIFSTFETYISSEGDRTVTYIGVKNAYMVSFYSKKLYSIMSGSDDPELNNMLLNNAEVYCAYSGEKEYLDENGLTHVLPYFDAIGLSTRYYKNDREWKSKTIMLATNRKDLMEKVKKAAKNKPENE